MSEGIPNATPIPPAIPLQTDPTLTVDTFIAEVPVDANRSILVYRRRHGGRTFIRWREFHRHRKGRNWYPDKWRSFVIPLGAGETFASAIVAAVSGRLQTPKPDWLAQIDAWREHRYRLMVDLNAPPECLEAERRKRHLAWGMSRNTSPFASEERAQRRKAKQMAMLEKAQELLGRFRGGPP